MTEPVLIEVCVDSISSALAAERGGAQRLELCSDLLEGGITPSLGLLEAVRSRISIALHAIVRPRPGDFCYSEEEFEVMRRDIELAKRAGANGVVFGILDPAGRVDVARTRELVELARPLSVTFHRAFDVSAELYRSLEEVCQTGADRLLTSGGEADAVQGTETISKLVKLSQNRVTIMAGGGITAANAALIIERTSVGEIHVGLGTPIKSSMLSQKARVLLNKTRNPEYDRTEVLEENVRKLRRVAADVHAPRDIRSVC
jgi:copper homeostasis protein